MDYDSSFLGRKVSAVAILAACIVAVLPAPFLQAAEHAEILRYEITWNGNKAGHGDITTTTDSKHVSVIAQAVSDGVLKALCEIWSRVQGTFTPGTFKPKTYTFNLRSNVLRHELVDLNFNHDTKMVQVNKVLGGEQECHSENFSGTYDPITAIFLLRSQKDFSKPTYVDIYDGRDKSRLFVNPAGLEHVRIKTGIHPAVCLQLRLVKLGGKKEELATGRLWISNDQRRIPLLLTSSPLVGTIRFELVQAQL